MEKIKKKKACDISDDSRKNRKKNHNSVEAKKQNIVNGVTRDESKSEHELPRCD